MKEDLLNWEIARYKHMIGRNILMLRSLYREKHKTILRICDILVIFSILFNMGAIVITNALVVKEDPTSEFHEANPSVRENFGFANAPNKVVEGGRTITQIWRALIIHGIKLMLLILSYVFLRVTSYNYIGLINTIVVALFMFALLGYDFNNDLGFWIGTLIWGS